MKHVFMAWRLGLVCLSMLLFPCVGSAQELKRVVVLEFEGKGATNARSATLDALKGRSDVELVGVKQAEAARQRVGGSWANTQTYQDVGAELEVAAFVEGNVQKVGQKFRATLRVRDASTGLVAHEEVWARKSLPQLKAISGNFWEVFGAAIQASAAPARAKAPPEQAKTVQPESPPPVDLTEAPTEAYAVKPRGPKSVEHPALVIWAGPRLMWRNLGYDDGDTNLDSYRIPGSSPAVNAALGMRWFPGAHVRGDFLSDIGLEAELDYALGLKSEHAGKKVSTLAYEASAAAVYRIPFDSFEPILRVGYMKHGFDAKVSDTTPMPGVSYSALRLGLGSAIFVADWMTLDLAAAYLHVLDAGEIGSSRFAPELSTRAFEFSAGLVGYMKERFGLRLGVDFRRYAFEFGKNAAGTLELPAGGSDHYLRVTAAFVYRLAGVTNAP